MKSWLQRFGELTAEELEKGWAWIDEQCDGEKHGLAKRFGLFPVFSRFQV